MRTLTTIVVILGALSFSMTDAAAPQSGKPAQQDCENAKTQAEMNQCSAAAYRAADKDLNALYASLKEKLDPDIFAKLQTAQRTWVNYRDANCEAESALYEGGSIQPTIRSSCLERATRARIEELHTIYDTGTR